MKFHHRWAGTALCLSALFCVSTTPAWAALSTLKYNVYALGTFGVRSGSIAVGINNTGQVAGQAGAVSPINQSNAHAFLVSNGAMHDLGTLGVYANPGGNYSYAAGINNNGQVVGNSNSRAFVYSDGAMNDLGIIGGATGINNNGQVVGHAQTANYRPHAFLYSNGVMTDLGTLGGWDSQAEAINDKGQVVGFSDKANGRTHAFLYSNGAMSDLGTLPGRSSSKANDINNNGQVVGISEGNAFLYDNGVWSDLGNLGGSSSEAFDINNNGEVVGRSYSLNNASEEAFLYRNGTMVNLNSLLPQNSGWQLTYATGINDLGQIVGRGRFDGLDLGYILSPETIPVVVPPLNIPPAVPIPAAVWLLGSGLIALGGVARKNRAS